MGKTRGRLRTVALAALLVVTAPVWLALSVLVVTASLVRTSALYLTIWIWWIGRASRRVVFVYSDSPNWKAHIERQILPRLPANSVVLNWSQRQHWRRGSVPILLFRTFAGEREFNPIALVFGSFALVKRYRFWQAFRDLKHGKPEPLQRVENAFFDRVGR